MTVPSVMKVIRSQIRDVSGTEVSLTEVRILSRLNRGTYTHGNLADELGMSLPALTRVMSRLEKNQDISRIRNPADGRSCVFLATAKGRLKFDTVNTKAARGLNLHLESLTGLEKNRLEKALPVLLKMCEKWKSSHDESESEKKRKTHEI